MITSLQAVILNYRLVLKPNTLSIRVLEYIFNPITMPQETLENKTVFIKFFTRKV